MIGINIDVCTYIYGNNQSVLEYMTAPDSNLKKKSNSIAYNHVQEVIKRGDW